jgi:hypothetical protein
MKRRLSTQLEFLAERPYDLLVSVKPCGDLHRVRRIEIFYAEHGALSGFEFKLQDALYAGERGKMLQAAAKALLAEIKSRMLASQEFSVWYYEPDGRELLDKEAGQIAHAEPVWQRAFDKLLRVGRVVNADSK